MPSHATRTAPFVRKNSFGAARRTPTAKLLIKNYDQHFASLRQALLSLRGFTMGLSLSGLEATAEPVWLLRLLELLQEFDGENLFDKKVLYMNGTGLFNHPALSDALRDAGFDRIELSRCHYDEKINQRIMRFNRDEPLRRNANFESLVRRAGSELNRKLSCILNRQGVCDIAEAEKYLSARRRRSASARSFFVK